MKRILLITCLLLLSSCSSTGLFSKTIDVHQLAAHKEKVDKTKNPAKQDMLKRDLENQPIALKNVIVKDIMVSSNVDYEYCLIVEVDSKKGKIECFVYSRDVKGIASLVKNKTKIDVSGIFNGYYSLSDHYYMKIDIVEAAIHLAKDPDDLIKETIGINQFVLEKAKIDKIEDADEQDLMNRELHQKRIILRNVTVKDIIPSNRFGYAYYAVAEANSVKGKIECQVYFRNAEILERLVKNKTRIDALGGLDRFSSTTGDYFGSMDITDATIQILE